VWVWLGWWRVALKEVMLKETYDRRCGENLVSGVVGTPIGESVYLVVNTRRVMRLPISKKSRVWRCGDLEKVH
jgi:hypothetical protein